MAGVSTVATRPHRARFLDRLSRTPVSGKLLRAVSLPLKAHYVFDRDVEARTGCRPPVQVPSQVEHFRWQQQITAAGDCAEDMELEADVVVIGSGAGGASAAYELASRGLAVVIVEEGQYYDRSHFNGRLTEVIPKLYRALGSNCATGNAIIPVPVGRNVGGTTTINSGTCMRTPEEVLADWQARGLGDFSAEAMTPWFEQVERGAQGAGRQTRTRGGHRRRHRSRRPRRWGSGSATRSTATPRAATARGCASSAAPRTPSSPPT